MGWCWGTVESCNICQLKNLPGTTTAYIKCCYHAAAPGGCSSDLELCCSSRFIPSQQQSPTNQEDLLIFKALVYNARNSESLWVLAAFRLQPWILSAKTKPLSHSCSPRMSRRRRLALLCFVSLVFVSSFFFSLNEVCGYN